MANSYLESVNKEFHYYKHLADRAMEHLSEEQLNWQYNSQSNSISTIVRHMSGNMLSRFTNFLTEDGEKPWRNRDEEFSSVSQSRDVLKNSWDKGWSCVFNAIESLHADDLEKVVFIRNEGHTVTEAVNRQLAHYSYHAGQIVYIAKMLNEQWESLTIPRNASVEYNAAKFAKEKTRSHFTNDMLTGSKPENEQNHLN